MKEDEIRPIAENYVEEYCHLPDGEYTDGSLVCAGIGTALIVSRQLEKRIKELEAYNEKLLDGDIEKHNKIVELQNRNGELAGQKASLGRWLGEAKEIIKEFVRVEYADFTNGDYSNELSKVLERAEDFLKEWE